MFDIEFGIFFYEILNYNEKKLFALKKFVIKKKNECSSSHWHYS